MSNDELAPTYSTETLAEEEYQRGYADGQRNQKPVVGMLNVYTREGRLFAQHTVVLNGSGTFLWDMPAEYGGRLSKVEVVVP